MSVFTAAGHTRIMDFDAGDVGYIEQSMPHSIENTGTEDLMFLEVFPTPEYRTSRGPSGWRTHLRAWWTSTSPRTKIFCPRS